MDVDNIVEVKNLKVYFAVTKGLLQRRIADVKAIDDVTFTIKRGETLGLVGESGCGKTTVGLTILRLYQPTAGQIVFEGTDITNYSRTEMRKIRHKMQLVFQDPFGSLDPRQSAGSIVGEPIKIHGVYPIGYKYTERVRELFQLVGLDPLMQDRYPHEFSGGQRQRLAIARALSCNPSLIVCDEPISALDVSIQAQIINLLYDLQEKFALTYLFIAHDLSVVKHLCDRIAVMYLGHIVELTESESLYNNPLHPYTKALLSAIPIPDPFVEEQRSRVVLEGDVPSPINPPSGCSFHPRCPIAVQECKEAIPPLREISSNHQVACIRVGGLRNH